MLWIKRLHSHFLWAEITTMKEETKEHWKLKIDTLWRIA